MLHVFGFDHIGVAVADLYFLDPRPLPGQEGPEQGVRIEVRSIERGGHEGSVYASRPIVVAQPIWRVDLLESVANPGSLDRAHHHPRAHGWEPGRRHFEEELTDDPLTWVTERLEHFDTFAGARGIHVEEDDASQLRRAVPEIMGTVRQVLDRIRCGELAQAPAITADGRAREGWL